jgi:hypothetical protein
MTKKVKFNLDKNSFHETYSTIEYDRHQIDSILYLLSYRKITQKEWIIIMKDLNKFKTQEMQVHIDSIHNTHIN